MVVGDNKMKGTSENIMENQGGNGLEPTVVIPSHCAFCTVRAVAALSFFFIEMVLTR
jgi:hypothetical protein